MKRHLAVQNQSRGSAGVALEPPIRHPQTSWLRWTLLLLLGIPMMAQTGSAVPRGSYLSTCNAFRMSGAMLTATCATGSNPSSFRTSINVTACEGDIWNNTGALGCFARRGTWGQGAAIPRGSYTDSCSRPFVQGSLLSAACKDRNGNSTPDRRSTLDLRACRLGAHISNVDGQLVCLE